MDRRCPRFVNPAAPVIALALAASLLAGACADEATPTTTTAPAAVDGAPAAAEPYYGEPYRPQAHLTPARGWMGEPNGLVFHDGRYHLYYPYRPDGAAGEPTHWAHAASTDLIHWAHYPVALAPDAAGPAPGGSVVADAGNTSGLGTAAQPPLVTLYAATPSAPTEATGDAGTARLTLAYSRDGGTTWARLPEPVRVTPADLRAPRDPKVTWHAPTQRWVMVLLDGGRLRFYTSSDLKSWTYASDFAGARAGDVGSWTSPDLFRVVESSTGRERYVLLASVPRGASTGGAGGTRYYVGDFDGTRFTAVAGLTEALWLDRGADHTAFRTWDNAPLPDRQRLGIAWMSDPSYVDSLPTAPWGGAMTSARVLSLYETKAGPRLKVLPVPDYYEVRRGKAQFNRLSTLVPTDMIRGLTDALAGPLEIDITTLKGVVPHFTIELASAGGDTLAFGYDSVGAVFFVDRSRVAAPWAPGFAARHTMPNPRLSRVETLRILLDRSSVEIFGDDGYAVMTDQYFLRGEPTGLRLLGSAPVSGTAHTLEPALPTPESATRVGLGLK